MEPLGRHLGALGGSWAVIWLILGAARRIFGALGALLEPLVEVLGVSWELFGDILGPFGEDFGAILELGRHLRSDLMKL